jgi:threonine/homoserine/homoserine lactone efflux protein
MAEELNFLISGMILGLAAGLSPGPLLALLFTETVKHGRREGIKVAISPLVTDLPIVLFVLFILSSLTEQNLVIGTISLLGASYLMYLGIENLRTRDPETGKYEVRQGGKGALRRGVITNLLSPHPYLFWLSIGGPIILRSLSVSVSVAALFAGGLYSSLVGSKIGVALIVGKSRSLIGAKYYSTIVRGLGIVLVLFALVFMKEGLELLALTLGHP